MKANQIISTWWSRANANWLGQTSEARRHRRALGRTGMGIGRGVFLFGLSLVLLYPILIMLSISMRTGAEMYDPTVIWIPKHITLHNFTTIWTELDIARSLMMSAIASIVSTVLQLISCIITGYGFARFDFPGKKLLFGILLLMIIVPPQVVTIPSMMDFQRFDFFGIGQLVGLFTGDPLTVSLRDNLIAYFLPALFGNGIKSGLFIFIFIQFFRGLPQELELPSAPKQFIHYFEEDNRPQANVDRNLEGGMAISLGRLREDTLFDYKFVGLSHNTLRGAAGGAVEIAELLYRLGYLSAK